MKNKIYIVLIFLILFSFYSCKSISDSSLTKEETYEKIENYLLKSKLYKAKGMTESYLKDNSDDSIVLCYYGLVLYAYKRYNDSINAYEKAIQLEDDDYLKGKYHYNLGFLYYEKGMRDKAYDEFIKSIKYNDTIDSSFYFLGLIEFENNQIDKCIKYWIRYTEVSSNVTKRENIIKIIDILKNKK
jgi:tetratricopeptide (TPR) repeat protein